MEWGPKNIWLRKGKGNWVQVQDRVMTRQWESVVKEMKVKNIL
jgi:hypothetical protein